MTVPIHRTTASSITRGPLSAALAHPTNALRRLAARFAIWFERRRRVAADRSTLARMSDRELLDHGLDRGNLNAVAEGAWRRDYPY